MRDNDIVEPCRGLWRCIIDWETYRLLPQEIRESRIEMFRKNPIHVNVIKKWCNFHIKFRMIEGVDGTRILRFVGHAYDLGALSDDACMKIIHDIHVNVIDITCSEEDYKLYRSYTPWQQVLDDIERDLSLFSTDMSPFVCGL